MPPQVALQLVGLVFSVIFGAVVGSFLNVCIYRLPWEKSIIWPASHCPQCLRPVRALDNIPILSWFLLRGRCRHCGEQFSARYMLIELLTAAIFGITYWLTQPAGLLGHVAFAGYAFLLSSLIAASFIDLDFQVVPDSVTVPGMVLGLVLAGVAPQMPMVLIDSPAPSLPLTTAGIWVYTLLDVSAWGLCALGFIWLVQHRSEGVGAAEWILVLGGSACLVVQTGTLLLAWGVIGPGWVGWQAWLVAHPHFQGFLTGLMGLIVGSGLIWVVRVLGSAAMRREAMGFGDVTLMAMVGAFLGWQAVVAVFFIAPFVALAVGLVQWITRGNRVLPYVPYLSLAALTVLWWWPPIWGVLGPRLQIMGLLGFAILGGILLCFLPILLLCLRINSRLNEVPLPAGNVSS
jgi:leader peptidase (prepilin peptidase)/N-methyltransferase